MQKVQLTGPLMYLWRPSPVITIGRHQNPWKECILSKVDADGVKLARRRSGGGAVFQDLGCSVFTFIAPSEYFSIDRNFDVVLGALQRLGIQAERSGRNDITVGGKKISGSAFKHAPDRQVSLHHGTILVDTDFKALQRYLTPDKRKLQAKGIASVGARVLNLKDTFPSVNHSTWSDAMIATYGEIVGNGMDLEIEEIGVDSPLTKEPGLLEYRSEMTCADWNLGRTPEFSHQLDTRIDGIGVFDVHMEVVAGRVKEVVIFSDALYPEVIDKSMAALTGVEYGRRGMQAALGAIVSEVGEGGPRQSLEAMTNWLVSNVDD